MACRRGSRGLSGRALVDERHLDRLARHRLHRGGQGRHAGTLLFVGGRDLQGEQSVQALRRRRVFARSGDAVNLVPDHACRRRLQLLSLTRVTQA